MKLSKERRDYYDKAIQRRKTEEVELKRIADIMKEEAAELQTSNQAELKELRVNLQSELLDVKEQNKVLVR